MYPPPPQHDLPPVGHLRDSRQLWELELYDQLQCMPEELAQHIAESFVWWIRGMKRAWLWWALRAPGLTRYLDGLLDMLEEFRAQDASEWPCRSDEEFALQYLADCWVRVELTAEIMCWPVVGVHLPCWQIVLMQAEESRHRVGGPQEEHIRCKATSSVIGIKAMGQRFNVLMTIQVPLKQRARGEIIVTTTSCYAQEDVINAIDDLEKLYSACSGSARLADSSFDFMKQELQDILDISGKVQFQPPTKEVEGKLFPGSWSGVRGISTRRAPKERCRPIETILALTVHVDQVSDYPSFRTLGFSVCLKRPGLEGKDLSLGVAVGSSTQIALLVVPFSVIVGWCYDVPMTLDFRPFDTSVLLLSVLMISLVLRDGASNWLEGAILIAIYVLVGIMCWFIPKHEHGEA
ncbi:Vacuolar calcium ion transporter [Symbiodinium microadriaticum]|uniref:Vacuolar calcium ion transporter n=1 Tax=Symbiodinium microadriaticum TaxID=2951 RepID=A0A1Q9EP85_SYMMI|nr:Vacuolar calcium ion transporter [Symbiodinium microadriaticum]